MADAAAPSSSNLVTSQQHFTVSNWDAILPLMQQMADETASMRAASHYDWTRADNQVLFRSTFSDAEALLDHFDSVVTPLLESFLMPGVASQEKPLTITGTPNELAKIQERLGALDAEYFETPEGFQTGYIWQTGIDNSEMATGQGTFCSSQTTFKVNDWNSAAPIVREFIDRTGLEKGCTYFGWSSKGEDLSWHGNYASGSALRDHFVGVAPLIAALNSGPAKLVKIELHGPSNELDKARAATGGIEPVIRYESDHRVQRLVQRFDHPKQS
jgi:quinol monooxygenase YgiN